MATDPRTQAYVPRRTSEGKTTREIIRCLERYVAREVYKTLTGPRPGARPAPATPRNSMIT
jgi:transposase